MNHEQPDNLPLHEQNTEKDNNFSRSADRLFSLLDKSNVPSYYSVQWDENQPDTIIDLATMECHSTGARKQEYKGKFHQAQFRITETLDSDQSVREYFAWVQTGLQTPGTEAIPQTHDLLNRYGYHKLDGLNIAAQLAQKATTVHDYTRLIDEMKNRQIESFPELAKGLGKVVYSMSFDFSSTDALRIDTPEGRAVILNLLRTTDEVDMEVSKYVRGRSLSRLMRSMSEKGGDYTTDMDEEKRTAQDAAAQTLQLALKENLFAQDKQFYRYILAKHHIYRYPFATELLHEQLADGYDNNSRKQIFGSDRGAFINDYIVSVIDGQVRQAEQSQNTPKTLDGVKELLRKSTYRRFTIMENPKFTALKNLANDIEPNDKEDGGAETSDKDTRDDYTTGEALAVVLNSLTLANTPGAKEQSWRNMQSAEIVDTLMMPIVKRRLGKDALKSVNNDYS